MKLSKNKTLEAAYYLGLGSEGISINYSLSSRGDHAGLHFSASIYKLFVEFNICDNRHWNWEENRFYNYSIDKESSND